MYKTREKKMFSGYWTRTELPAMVEKKDTDIIFLSISGFSFKVTADAVS